MMNGHITSIRRDSNGFPQPEDSKEAAYWIDLISDEIDKIEAQLQDRNKKDVNGKRQSIADYWDWNSRARRALMKLRRDRRILYRFIEENDGNGHYSAVVRLNNILGVVSRNVKSMNDYDKAIYDEAVEYVKRRDSIVVG